MDYTVVIEHDAEGGGWGAYVPALPGCTSVGDTEGEVLQAIQDAIRLHVAGLIEDGLPVPQEPAIPWVRLARVRIAA